MNFIAENTTLPSLNYPQIEKWIKETAHLYHKKVGNLNYIICDDDKILEINQHYLQHDYYTDIITFDYSKGAKISGDIYISINTVESNAEKLQVRFDDELLRVIIHGVLHLCGQNDKTEEEAKEMRKKENLAIEKYGELSRP